MISNFYLRTQINNLKKERDILVQRKLELIQIIGIYKISKQAAWKQNSGRMDKIEERTLLARNNATAELTENDKKLIIVNTKLRELHRQEDSEKNKTLMKIFDEIFTEKQKQEIYNECDRRMNGEHPFKIDFNIQEGIEAKGNAKKYKQLASEQLEKMAEIRVILTGVIEQGCKQFGKAEFLKVISPLNRHIIPLEEMTKIKRRHSLYINKPVE